MQSLAVACGYDLLTVIYFYCYHLAAMFVKRLDSGGLLRYGFVEYEGRESIDIGMLFGDAGDYAVIFDSEIERAALCVREGNDVIYDFIV
ncbi:hypothetical protein I010019E5_15590 [Bifidobacterium adolescentis]